MKPRFVVTAETLAIRERLEKEHKAEVRARANALRLESYERRLRDKREGAEHIECPTPLHVAAWENACAQVATLRAMCLSLLAAGPQAVAARHDDATPA